MSNTQNLKGRASLWLLTRPSQQKINQASLAAAYVVMFAVLLFVAATGLLQWILGEAVHRNQNARAFASLQIATATLEMTQQVGDAHRSTLAFLLARDPMESRDALERRLKAIETYRQALLKIQPLANTHLAQQKEQTTSATEDYVGSSAKLIEIVQSGLMGQALDYRLQTVRPLFEAWQTSHESLALSLTEQANAKMTDTETFIRRLRTALLVLIIIPIVLLGLASLSIAMLFGWEKFTAKSQTTIDPWSH